MTELEKTPWGAHRSYVCDDARGADAGAREEVYQLTISQGGNGDWYVSVLPRGHRIGPTVRLRTSGGASTGCPGLTTAVADAYRALGGEPVNHAAEVDEAASFRAMLQGLGCGNDEAEELAALREEVQALRAEVESYRNPPPDRGRLINAAASAGAAVVEAAARLASTPKKRPVDYERARVGLAAAEARQAAADAALAGGRTVKGG